VLLDRAQPGSIPSRWLFCITQQRLSERGYYWLRDKKKTSGIYWPVSHPVRDCCTNSALSASFMTRFTFAKKGGFICIVHDSVNILTEKADLFAPVMTRFTCAKKGGFIYIIDDSVNILTEKADLFAPVMTRSIFLQKRRIYLHQS
jgi:hypothetical protein